MNISPLVWIEFLKTLFGAEEQLGAPLKGPHYGFPGIGGGATPPIPPMPPGPPAGHGIGAVLGDRLPGMPIVPPSAMPLPPPINPIGETAVLPPGPPNPLLAMFGFGAQPPPVAASAGQPELQDELLRASALARGARRSGRGR